jgi:3',5'-cyclic AMP phosphodiesterase CpdA
VLIAQLSDFHVRRADDPFPGIPDTAESLGRAAAALAGGRTAADVAVLTGDIVDRGLPEEYARMREALAPLRMPLLALPGNHDSRDALLAAFADQPWRTEIDGFVQYAVEDWPVRILCLDTTIPGRTEGELCDRRLDWLAERLEERVDSPTVVAMHHPPFATGIGYMDAWGLVRGAGRLASILGAHPQVERVICGHIHRSVQRRWAGTVAMVAPSTAHQIELDLRPEPDMAFRLEPPGYLLHAMGPDRALVSHLVPVGDFGPARSFGDGEPVG